MTVTTREPLEQRRAKFAYEAVKTIKSLTSNDADKIMSDYGRQAVHLPVSILQNGLGQAIAFLLSKAKNKADSAHGRLVQDVGQWLDRHRQIIHVPADGHTLDSLMEALLQADLATWRRAEREALELAAWLKRFAEAFLP